MISISCYRCVTGLALQRAMRYGCSLCYACHSAPAAAALLRYICVAAMLMALLLLPLRYCVTSVATCRGSVRACCFLYGNDVTAVAWMPILSAVSSCGMTPLVRGLASLRAKCWYRCWLYICWLYMCKSGLGPCIAVFCLYCLCCVHPIPPLQTSAS